MDAKIFISKKHDAALDELKAIEAEYRPRLDAARAMITLTESWLNEIGPEKGSQSPISSEVSKSPSESWVSARDLSQGRAN